MTLEATTAGQRRFTVMKRVRLPLFALLLGSLAACEKRDPVADEANAIPAAPVDSDSAGTAAGGPPSAAATNGAAATGPIPATIQGRWGLTPADCISTRGDAKGLLIIAADSLKFYESRATPTTSIEANDEGISGNWAFEGEGETWSKYVSFKLQGDGLVRTERNPPTTYTYARCD